MKSLFLTVLLLAPLHGTAFTHYRIASPQPRAVNVRVGGATQTVQAEFREFAGYPL